MLSLNCFLHSSVFPYPSSSTIMAVFVSVATHQVGTEAFMFEGYSRDDGLGQEISGVKVFFGH